MLFFAFGWRKAGPTRSTDLREEVQRKKQPVQTDRLFWRKSEIRSALAEMG